MLLEKNVAERPILPQKNKNKIIINKKKLREHMIECSEGHSLLICSGGRTASVGSEKNGWKQTIEASATAIKIEPLNKRPQ